MSLNRNFLKLTVIGAVVAAVLVVGLLRFRSQDTANVHPKRGPIVEAIYGIGTVTSRNQFHFKVGVTRTLLKANVREGDNVKKGQVLLELSDGLRVSAPFDGTVTSFPLNTGENVFPDIIAITVENLQDRYVLATLEQLGALRVKTGLSVSLNFESIRDQRFGGRVVSIYPQKGQFLVKVEVDQLPATILPGMTADISIEVNRRENALLVPALAISHGQVLLDREGKQLRQSVEIGSMDSEWAEVIKGDIQLTDKILLKK